MSTVDSVFLIITGTALSLFFLIGTALLIASFGLIKSAKRVVVKAEGAIDSVESATEVIKHIGNNASGPLAALKVINNIIKLVNRK
jgi:ABC-type nickel/cobalt efflux system permease component RcnA